MSVNTAAINSLSVLLALTLLFAAPPPITAAVPDPEAACPLWFVRVRSGNNSYCECGDDLDGRVHCDNVSQRVSLRSGTCMTFDSTTNLTLVGGCLYTANYYVQEYSNLGYIQLPRNVSELNDFVCGPYDRDGLLCGSCKDGFSPGLSTFIYNHKCVYCDDQENAAYGWLAFIAVQLLPTTAVFVIIVAFQVSAVTPSMNALVFVCQLTTLPEFISFMSTNTAPLSSAAERLQEFLFSLYGVWNLNLLRPYIPNICLSRFVDSHVIFIMEFTSVGYLLFLMVATYVGIVLHGRNCRVVVYLWKPFNKCFTRFKRTWNLQFNMIDAFATFLLLCYNKIALICIRLLSFVRVNGIHGNRVGPPLYYYDPHVKFFSTSHIPIVIISMLILSVAIVIPPLLLMFYQAKLFQKCLNCSRIRWYGLRTFVDKYQGCFKDGHSWGRDYRYFAGLYFALRVLFAVIVITADEWAHYLLALSVAVSLSFALLRPYKRDLYNKLDSLIFAVLALAYFYKVWGEKIVSTGGNLEDYPFFTVSLVVMGLLPLIYAFIFAFYSLVIKRKLLRRWYSWTRERRRRKTQDIYAQLHATADKETDPIVGRGPTESHELELSNSFPDRIRSPLRYQTVDTSVTYTHVEGDS